MTPTLPSKRERARRLARPSRLCLHFVLHRLHQLARPRRGSPERCPISDVRRRSVRHLRWSVHRPHQRSARLRHWAHSSDRHLRSLHLRSHRANRRSSEQRYDHRPRSHRSWDANIRHKTDCARSAASYRVVDARTSRARNHPHRSCRRKHRSPAATALNWARCGSNRFRYCPAAERRSIHREPPGCRMAA
jgi:hypothetical protein